MQPHFNPHYFMTARCEIALSPGERARRQACRSGESAITAQAFINNAG
jgi:hypothetical protein